MIASFFFHQVDPGFSPCHQVNSCVGLKLCWCGTCSWWLWQYLNVSEPCLLHVQQYSRSLHADICAKVKNKSLWLTILTADLILHRRHIRSGVTWSSSRDLATKPLAWPVLMCQGVNEAEAEAGCQCRSCSPCHEGRRNPWTFRWLVNYFNVAPGSYQHVTSASCSRSVHVQVVS